MAYTRSTSNFIKEVMKKVATPKTWGKREYYKDGKYCLLGAIEITATEWFRQVGPQPLDQRLEAGGCYHQAEKFIREAITEKWGDIGILHFNDNPRRRHSSIISVLKKALTKSEKYEKESK